MRVPLVPGAFFGAAMVGPQAYKDIECVIDAERDLVEPLVRLVPIENLKG